MGAIHSMPNITRNMIHGSNRRLENNGNNEIETIKNKNLTINNIKKESKKERTSLEKDLINAFKNKHLSKLELEIIEQHLLMIDENSLEEKKAIVKKIILKKLVESITNKDGTYKEGSFILDNSTKNIKVIFKLPDSSIFSNNILNTFIEYKNGYIIELIGRQGLEILNEIITEANNIIKEKNIKSK